jgi:hypothetical protein
MLTRNPQINFQVAPCVKTLYDEARQHGHWVARLCAAGLLLMVEDPVARARAISRLRAWEAEFEHASQEQIGEFVAGAQAALQRGARGNRPGRRARPPGKKAKRA